MRFILDRNFYIPKDATPITRDGINGIVYTYKDRADRFSAIAFRGKAQKPEWHYIYRNEESRQQAINHFFNCLASSAKFNQELRQEREEGAKAFGQTIKAGDYFSTSWGYDQTNIDFLIVVSVSPTKKSVLCRMAEQTNHGNSGGGCDHVGPGPAFGEAFRMKVSDDCLIGSYPFCPGSKRHDYFRKTDPFSSHYQTALGWGH